MSGVASGCTLMRAARFSMSTSRRSGVDTFREIEGGAAIGTGVRR